MPKIRGVKPEFWTDEDVVELTIPARLLFIGLWNLACDNGHLQDKSKQIKMRILPTDDVNCADLLREIEAQKLIERADGWITIPNLTHHQKPHKRWWVICEKPGCAMPAGASYGYSKPETTVVPPLNNREQPVVNGGTTADGDVDGDVELKVSGSTKPPRTRGHQIPDTWRPSDQHRGFAAENRIDLDRETAKFRDHHQSKGSVMKDWDAAFRKWLRNAQEWRGDAVGPVPAEPAIPHVSAIEQPPDGLSPQEFDEWDRARRKRQAASR